MRAQGSAVSRARLPLDAPRNLAGCTTRRRVSASSPGRALGPGWTGRWSPTVVGRSARRRAGPRPSLGGPQPPAERPRTSARCSTWNVAAGERRPRLEVPRGTISRRTLRRAAPREPRPPRTGASARRAGRVGVERHEEATPSRHAEWTPRVEREASVSATRPARGGDAHRNARDGRAWHGRSQGGSRGVWGRCRWPRGSGAATLGR